MLGNKLARSAFTALGCTALMVSPSLLMAQDGSGRGSNQANYHLMQLTVKTDQISYEDFNAKTREITSCGDARKLAKALDAEVKRDRFVMPHQIPDDLKAELEGLETGKATQVFTADASLMRVIVICHRV